MTIDPLVRTEISTKSDNYDNYDNYDDFPDAYTIFLEIKSIDKSLNQGEKGDFDDGIEAKTAETVEISNEKNYGKNGNAL